MWVLFLLLLGAKQPRASPLLLRAGDLCACAAARRQKRLLSRFSMARTECATDTHSTIESALSTGSVNFIGSLMAMYKLPLALVLVASLVGEAAAFHTAAAMRPGSLAAHRSSAPAMATYQFVPQLAPLSSPRWPSLLTAASTARAGPIPGVLVAVLKRRCSGSPSPPSVCGWSPSSAPSSRRLATSRTHASPSTAASRAAAPRARVAVAVAMAGGPDPCTPADRLCSSPRARVSILHVANRRPACVPCPMPRRVHGPRVHHSGHPQVLLDLPGRCMRCEIECV